MLRMRRGLWLLLFLQAVAVVLVLHPWTTPDTIDYIRMARGLASGGFGQIRDGVLLPEAIRPPGYPGILWLLHEVLRLPLAVVVGLQVGAFLGCIALVEKCLRRVGIPGWPLLALLVIYPAPLAYTAIIGTEAGTMVAVALAWTLFVWPGRPGWWRLGLVGALSGFAALIRPNLILFPLLMAVLVLVPRRQESSRAHGGRATGQGSPGPWSRELVGKGAVVLASAALVLAPYAARNLAVFGWPFPLPPATPAGTSLYLASWQELFEQEDVNEFYHGRVTDRMREIGFDTAVARINTRLGLPPRSPPFTPTSYERPEVQLRVARTYRTEALRRIAEEPGPYVRHVVRNIWQMWNVQAYPDAVPGPVRLLLQVVSGILWAAGLGVAVASLVLPCPIWLRASSAIVLYFLFIQAGLHTESRYTAPARLFLVINAVVAVRWLVGGSFPCSRSAAGSQDAGRSGPGSAPSGGEAPTEHVVA